MWQVFGKSTYNWCFQIGHLYSVEASSESNPWGILQDKPQQGIPNIESHYNGDCHCAPLEIVLVNIKAK